MAILVKNHIAPFINAALNAEPISGYWFGFSSPVFARVKVLHVRMILGRCHKHASTVWGFAQKKYVIIQ